MKIATAPDRAADHSPGFRHETYSDRAAMGAAAAQDIAGHLRTLLAHKPLVRMIFASAPSQADMLAALARAPGIDWSRVIAFHMDEYVGLDLQHPAAFGPWL
ncbi:MAG: hypothetical protein ACO1OK_11730, partial [Devosia sp.]